MKTRTMWCMVVLVAIFTLSGCKDEENKIDSIVIESTEAVDTTLPAPSLEPTDNQEFPITEGMDVTKLFNIHSCPAPNSNAMASHQLPNVQLTMPPADLRVLDGIKAISINRLYEGSVYGYEPGGSFALDREGNVYGWGTRFDDWHHTIDYPVSIAGLPAINQIAGEYALTSEGNAWFMNGNGNPYMIEGLKDVAAITEISGDILAAVTADAELWLWRPATSYGREEKKPMKVLQAGPVQAVFGDDAYSLYWIERDSTIKTALVDSDLSIDKIVEIRLPEGENAKRIEVTFSDDFILTESGALYRYGDEGVVKTTHTGVVELTGSDKNIYYVKADGTVWGEGNYTSLPNMSALENLPDKPSQIKGLSNIVDIQAGLEHVLALSGDGVIYSWGSNSYGQLGKYPAFFDQFTPVGSIQDLQNIHLSFRGLEFIADGNVWGINSKMEVIPVLLDQTINKITSDGYLSEEGVAQLLNNHYEDVDPCFILSAAGGIRNVARDENGWITELSSGVMYKIEQRNHTVSRVKEVRFNDNKQPRIKSLVSHPFVSMLTDEGDVYYKYKETEEAVWMERIPNLPFIQEWTTLYYTIFESGGKLLRALDDRGQAYGVEISEGYVENEENEVTLKKFELLPLSEDVAHLYGGLMEKVNGEVVDTSREPFSDEYLRKREWSNLLKKPIDIQAIGSMYVYYGEGPSGFHHVLVGEDGTIMIYGDSPFFQADAVPSVVKILN